MIHEEIPNAIPTLQGVNALMLFLLQGKRKDNGDFKYVPPHLMVCAIINILSSIEGKQMNGTIFVMILKYSAACHTFPTGQHKVQQVQVDPAPPIGSVAYDGCSFLMSGGYSLHSICLIQLSQCIILTSPTTIP
jgi:hypothetical protein